MKTIFPFQQVCDAEFKEMFQHHCNIGTDKCIIDTLNDERNIDGIKKNRLQIAKHRMV